VSADVGRRLRAARTYLNFAPDYVSRETGVTRARLDEIERGGRAEGLELKRLARLYGYPTSFFRGADGVVAEETVQVLTRLGADLTATDRAEIMRFATYLRCAGQDSE
jgi:transcriptional regulator with XRE-family HTH domain